MDSISRLREILVRALGDTDLRYGEQDLFDELMVQKSRLLNLFDVGRTNQQERREIESGKTVIDGKPVAVNSDFAQQVIFLSQQLDTSERYVASLLHTVMSKNPNTGPATCIELTISEFHQRRRHLVECLCYLLEASEASESPNALPTYTRIGNFVRNELISSSLASNIIKEIEDMGSAVGRADMARKNAGSTTVGPTAQGTPTLSYDILNARYDSLKYERRHLGTALSSIARLGSLSTNEVKSLIEWLSANPNHTMTYYILTAILVAFDPVNPETSSGIMRQSLSVDVAMVAFMATKFAPSTEWKDPGLKATLLLKWALFLTEARHRDASLENRSGFKTEELEAQIWNAVQGDAFSYLSLAVVQLERRQGNAFVPSLISGLMPSLELQEQREPPSEEFKMLILLAFETLARSLITHASSELRKIKQRQEDLVLAGTRSDRTRGGNPRFSSSLTPDPSKPPPRPRSDIAVLYSFIGLLYSALAPESALQFWGSGPQADSSHTSYLEYIETTAGKLPAFLQWAVWSTPTHDLTMSTALYDMLTGLSKGLQCSELAYNFMARGGGEIIPGSMLPSSSSGGPSVSWGVVFGLLDSWAASFNHPRGHPPAQPLAFSQFGASSLFSNPPPASKQPSPIPIGPKEVLLAQSFLRLLSVVVSHSVAVRVAISGHAQFRAIPTLVSLIPLGVPLELKGALFETLAAFCEPGAGTPGIEICKAVWTLMERLEVINVRVGPSTGFSAALAAVKGVEVELEEIEAVHRLYPATIPFLKLLSTLIHTPKRIPLKDRVRDVEPINTIPESLGQPYRLPGIGPFASFVIDNVFARIPNREYSRPSDRWQINDLCLSFIERILASYELGPLTEGLEDIPQRNTTINSLLVHPGYDVMKRLLTNSPLQASILSYIVEGLEGFEKGVAEEEPFFRSTIIRVLRIVHRVLELQDAFLDILIPTLSDIDSASLGGTTYARSFFTRFDQALLFSPRYVPALAAYMVFSAQPELVLLSVKILALISSSSPTSSLITLIERSSDSDRILAGFMQIMGVESTDDVWDAEAIVEQATGAGAADTEILSPPLEQGIRLAALDFLIQETDSSRPYSNLAHYLLFGTSANYQQVQDPSALGSRRTAIHVLIDTVNLGIPRLKGKQRNGQHQTAPLFVTLPGLAERCYRVIYQLCVHPHTSDFMTRYLRTREDFFARQLLSIPSQIPASAQESYIQIQYRDGARVATSVPASSAFLRLRSYIFDLVALELHILTNKGHFKGVSQLINILLGNGDSLYDDSQNPEDDIFQEFHEIGQSNLRIIELLQSLTFDWSDSLTVQPMELQFLAELNLHSCVRTNMMGCEIVDRNTLFLLLATAKHTLHARGAIITPAHAEQLGLETTYVLESCAVENHRREISYAIACNFASWRRLLDITLTKCFDQLQHNKRENMLFDLLHILPAAAQSAEIGEPTAILLSEAVLSCVTKLREDRRHQVIIQSAGGDNETGSLPAERLYGILRSILEGILDNNRVELVRGNLYASLINYVHLISSSHDVLDIHMPVDKLAISLSSSITQEETSLSNSQALVPMDRAGRLSTPSLEKGSLSVLKGVMDRLVTTISRDAIDGTEVWKTIAFMLLDALVHLSNLEKNPTVLLALTRHGILSNFVRGIKDADLRLQSVLKPDPDDLNPLYVYEAKLSLFIRMSQTRAGSERLLESQLIPILAQCDYLDARPEADHSFMEHDSFLPSAVHRYHQLFMPALQVIDGMLATLGSKHATLIHQAVEFLSSHSSTIVILLKTDSEAIPTALLDQIHLIVVLSMSVLPSIPKSELLSTTSGFGAIHAAILSLSARCLGRQQFFARILPQSDAEISSSHVLAFGHDGDTKFDVSVRKKEALLRKDIIAYIGTASEFTEPEITLVLSPVTTTSSQERGTYILATIPTIGNTLEALNNLCGDLTETLKQIADLSAELSSKDHIGVDNIQEIVQDIHLTFLQDLDIGQKRSLIYQELEKMRADVKRDAKLLLDSTEMLLLLVWRHLGYYADGHHKLNKSTHGMKFISEPEPETLRADVGKQLSPALQRLADLNYELLGHDWQANQGYIEIMCRRLRDTAGLHSEQED